MKVVKHESVIWEKDDTHNMEAGFHSDLPSNMSADVMFARIQQGDILPLHWHTRPLDIDGADKGFESFFFFRGGHFVISDGSEEREFCVSEPITITFESGINNAHSVRNIGSDPLEFQVLCAPRFADGEEHLM